MAHFLTGPRKLLLAGWLISLPLLAGCGPDGPERAPVWGTVTWKGQPVPSGVLFFNPDTTKEHSGPQGYARITNGAYDTRSAECKGCVAGPHRVIVQGADGQNPSATHPYGKGIFQSYETEFVVPAAGGEFNVTVPDSVRAAPKNTEPD